MNVLRRRINPKTFVITNRQLAKYLKIDTTRIWRWEKWVQQTRRSPFLEKMRSPSETTLLITTIEAVEVSRV